MTEITRRNFLKISSAGVAGAVLTGCQNPPRWVKLEPYVIPPEEQLDGVATWYASTCRQCPAGCGILVRVMNGRALKIEGNPLHPLNQGKLCGRGQAGLQLLYNPDRLTGAVQQSQRGSRQYQEISWEAGINTFYEKIQASGDQLAVWLGSSTPDHLVEIFKHFTGILGAPSPVIYDLYSGFNGYPSLNLADEQIFGKSGLPAYDLSQADFVLSFGADFLGSWLSAVRYGIGYGRFRDQGSRKRGVLVQLEPRMSQTGAVADRWLPLRPGGEALVAQAIMRLIADYEYGPAERVAAAQSLATDIDVNQAQDASDIPLNTLRELAQAFATATHPLAIPGNSLSGLEQPLESISAVQALNIVSGNSQSPTGFSISTQPQAISAFSDVQKLITKMQNGEIKVLIIHAANPAFDLPPQAGFTQALSNVPLVVSFNPIVDETAVWADLILPDRVYLEGWGFKQTSPGFDQSVLGSQQPVVSPFFNSRSAADILLTIAQGFPEVAKTLPYPDEVAYLKARLGEITGDLYNELTWSRFLQNGFWSGGIPDQSKYTPSLTKIPVSQTKYQGDDSEYPYHLYLYLSTLLSDGRGANLPWLQGSPDPMTTVSWQTLVEIHPLTAKSLGLRDGDIVQIVSLYGQITAPVYLYPAIRPDTIAIPLGQGHNDYGRYARQRGSNPIQLLSGLSDASGTGFTWTNLRVKIQPTGTHTSLAIFENKEGVTKGFTNLEIPGQ
jgi:anaerobic selenocysteine-containing dehydrogenase